VEDIFNEKSFENCKRFKVYKHDDPTPVIVIKNKDGVIMSDDSDFLKDNIYYLDCLSSHDDCDKNVTTCIWSAKSFKSDGSEYIPVCISDDEDYHGGDTNTTETYLYICTNPILDYIEITLNVKDQFDKNKTVIRTLKNIK
jgi:hypothetical protein